jgi:hypothetical protein
MGPPKVESAGPRKTRQSRTRCMDLNHGTCVHYQKYPRSHYLQRNWRRKSRAVFDSAIASLPTRAGVEPAISRLSASAFSEVTARSLPPKVFPEETQAKLPGALPARRLFVRQSLVFAAHLAGGHGIIWWRSIFTFTIRKLFREKIGQSV